MIFVLILVGVVLLLLVALYALARFAVYPNRHTLEYEQTRLMEYPHMKDEKIEFENEHSITTYDGKKLWVAFVPGDKESKKYVILSHGYTSTRYGMYKYAVLWRKMGYNCVMYENRGHGVNEKAVVSFGVRESKDLMTVIEDTYERYGRDIQLGLHGESMGSGLTCMSLGYKPKVDFLVIDCGYAEILPVLAWKTESNFHLPGKLAYAASPVCKLFFGFAFEEAAPVNFLENNKIPICFVHGEEDTFVHKWHSEKMYDSNKGYKELHIFKGAEHACCVEVDPERYLKLLEAFVERVYSKKE